ncbi:MAG: glucose 1-dehydrogenase [Pseudomonadales bacterium]
MDRFSLRGRTALVTGASRGIGNGIARGLAEAGADIGVVYRQTADQADAFVDELLTMGRSRSFAHQADVTKKSEIDGMVDTALSRWSKIDILVNNAGTGRGVAAEEMSEETWDFIVDLNLKSVFFTSQAVGRQMISQGGGSIINVGSISALIVNNPQKQCHYNAAKAGVHMLTKCLAVEWVKHNIRVNAIAPGYVETDLTRPFMEENPEEAEKLWKMGTLQERFSAPSEMAGAAVYLASDASTFVTGEVMVVDGGYTLR